MRILVIDDEKVICDGCEMILADKGYVVDSRTTGALGLKALQADMYDLLLLDMKLPDMNGIEILRRVSREYPATHVIVMTGYSTVNNAVDAMKLGAFDYLAKPFLDDELVLSVERAVHHMKLVEENRSLRKQLHDRYDYGNIIGEHQKMLAIFEQITKVAPTESNVLIEGESGTGKELIARAVHAHSRRALIQFIAVDCSTLNPNLLESELFGHVKGAFTGAANDRRGIFEMADKGTLFLDEVANLNLEIQGKLLRVMESREYKPVGSSVLKKTDARIIAATNQDLTRGVKDGTFRDDLFYRLNVFPIKLPALRERREDIPRLVYHFLRMFGKETGKRIKGFTNEALQFLVEYEWPGNVRQLKNTIERLVIMADVDVLDAAYLADQLRIKRSRIDDVVPDTLEELKSVKRHLLKNRYGEIEKAFLVNALKACGGNVTRAAERVGMQRPNFHAMMKKHRLARNQA